MKIKWGALVVDGRNKIGGHVASKNRSGAYMRTKVTPVNGRSLAQVSVRTRLSTISAGWKALTAALIASWNNAVADYKKTDIFGDIQNPSGFNLYQKLNNNLANVGGTAITTPPLPVSVSTFSTISCCAAAGTPALSLAVAPATLPATEYLIVRATAPQSAGKSFVKSEFRQITVLTTITAGAANLLAVYTAKFGSVGAAGGKIFIEAVHVNKVTGQASQPQKVSCIVAV